MTVYKIKAVDKNVPKKRKWKHTAFVVAWIVIFMILVMLLGLSLGVVG